MTLQFSFMNRLLSTKMWLRELVFLKSTPARGLVAELVRRYSIIGFECTLLEIQKLGYFLERQVDVLDLENRFNFQFSRK